MIHLKGSQNSWGLVAKTLHWVMAVFILLQVFFGINLHFMNVSSEKGELIHFHKIFGTIILFLIIMLAILYSIVFVERSFRKIPIQYPQRTKGRKQFAGQSSHLPLKINAAGVIPPIFASSILLLPLTLLNYIDVPAVNQFAQSFLSNGFIYNKFLKIVKM